MKSTFLKPYILSAEGVSGDNGQLNYLENSQLPFRVKRVFWITGVPQGGMRGMHAHRTDQQLTCCLQGTVKVKLEDMSGKTYAICLDHPSKVLYLPPLVWSAFVFDRDAVLMVLAGEDFSETDYIRDKKEFEKLQDGYREQI